MFVNDSSVSQILGVRAMVQNRFIEIVEHTFTGPTFVLNTTTARYELRGDDIEWAEGVLNPTVRVTLENAAYLEEVGAIPLKYKDDPLLVASRVNRRKAEGRQLTQASAPPRESALTSLGRTAIYTGGFVIAIALLGTIVAKKVFV